MKVFADLLKVFIVIAADTNSIDTIWYVQIVESSCVGDHFLEKEKEL